MCIRDRYQRRVRGIPAKGYGACSPVHAQCQAPDRANPCSKSPNTTEPELQPQRFADALPHNGAQGRDNAITFPNLSNFRLSTCIQFGRACRNGIEDAAL
eukprot:TRINITY_DN795_c0_g2_i5.p2 TRINITY_DN795_c0_g2~~TRINITY_DN795_c0_g2_i5.p2  ORF type:complete len:100 (-),score=7.61 TRINITY_DN795_c0_g2_i5:421-720(-)